MRQLLVFGGMLAVFCFVPATASADWIDQFDAYANGKDLHGVNGWAGWDNDPQWTAFVTNAFSTSPDNSVDIAGASDLVHPYAGYTSGKWVYTARVYVPSTMVGLSYFLIQDTYNHGGPYAWAVQTQFDSVDGKFKGWFGSGTILIGPDYVKDDWATIQVSIDLDNDWCQVYYNGVLIDDPTVADHPLLGGGYTWTGGTFGNGGSVLNIGAVDLFANGATSVYYDDLSLRRAHRWADDLEAYAAGSQIVGQGGWEEWGAGAGALVSNAFARSGANSVDINGPTDLVYQYEGYNSGIVTYTAWQYIPTGFTGQSYFIMLNTYDAGGPYNWSVQFDFDASNNMVGGNFGASPAIDVTPILFDQWVEIKVVIDLNTDWVRIYYGGTELFDPLVGNGYQWTGGVFGGGTGALNVGALDLFANSASSIYYDDIAIDPLIPQLSGDVESISESAGGQCNMVLNSGFQNADRDYIILAGVTGVEPGFPLPGGLESMPLNWDAFTNIAIGLVNTPIMANFLGKTDNIGVATATFDTIGPQVGLAGLNLYFACTMNNPYDFASNAWNIRFLP